MLTVRVKLKGVFTVAQAEVGQVLSHSIHLILCKTAMTWNAALAIKNGIS